jgi:hypothetical protein
MVMLIDLVQSPRELGLTSYFACKRNRALVITLGQQHQHAQELRIGAAAARPLEDLLLVSGIAHPGEEFLHSEWAWLDSHAHKLSSRELRTA